MTQTPSGRPRPTPPWLLLLALVMAASAVGAVWLAHPKDTTELIDIVLAGVILELAGLIVALPIGLITGAYRTRPQDYPLRRRPPGFVAVVTIGLIGGLYLFDSNLVFLPKFASRDIWRYAPWDPRWARYWIVQGIWTAVYAGAVLASAALQAAWDRAEHVRRRRLAEARRPPLVL
jgi:hypothetical protein